MAEITEFSGFEVIRAAMEIERAGNRFYLEMSRTFPQAQLGELFIKLAEDEVEHLRALQELIRGYQQGAFWENEQEYLPYLKRFNEMEVFPNKDQVAAALGGPEVERKILELAIQAEKHFADFFAVAALFAKTEEGKKVFSWLANEENKHAELLEQQKKKNSAMS